MDAQAIEPTTAAPPGDAPAEAAPGEPIAADGSPVGPETLQGDDGPGAPVAEMAAGAGSMAAEIATADRSAARNLTRGTVLATDVEFARSFGARFMGLMGRRSLPEGAGLYLAGNGIHMLFMRFPIDALFVSAENGEGHRRVLAARSDLRPWTGLVPFIRHAAAVLELPAGTLASSGTHVGDIIAISG